MEMESVGVNRCVIITGMSGAGKSTALKILEDQGMFAIDNIPPALLSQLLFLLEKHRSAVRWGVAAVVDVRGDSLLDGFPAALEIIKKQTQNVHTIFFDAQDDVLLRRFESTRRRHPMESEGSLLDGIVEERDRLRPVLEYTDTVIDTSSLSLPLLRRELVTRFFENTTGVPLVVSSFGFKHGSPADCDYMFDVRFLDNPFYNPVLKPLSGRDKPVQEAVWGSEEFAQFWERLTGFLDYVIPLYLRSGKTQLHIGIGCTGGRHRSVAVAERLKAHFEGSSARCILRHRDIDKEQGW
ncbi:MAG: RNase adapter RapZ [Synergistaceae bacterium]|nr:RNase adapter RapZ [Synergistaceae bacterium]